MLVSSWLLWVDLPKQECGISIWLYQVALVTSGVLSQLFLVGSREGGKLDAVLAVVIHNDVNWIKKVVLLRALAAL